MSGTQNRSAALTGTSVQGMFDNRQINAVASRMVEALKGANRTVPQYLKALARDEH